MAAFEVSTEAVHEHFGRYMGDTLPPSSSGRLPDRLRVNGRLALLNDGFVERWHWRRVHI